MLPVNLPTVYWQRVEASGFSCLDINANHSFLINTENENDPIEKARAKYKIHPCIISINKLNQILLFLFNMFKRTKSQK